MDPRVQYKEYLKNKHTGGVNNAKGNAYEDLYATKVIIDLWNCNNELNSIAFVYQVENAFVDDLKIYHEAGNTTYCQLKNVQKLSWGDGNEKDLLFNFKNQKKVCSTDNEYFNLKIVYSSDACSVHTSEIPADVADVTYKELFYYFESPSNWVQSSSDAQSIIKQIIVSHNQKNFLVNAEAFVMSVMSCWQSLRKPGVKIYISDIKKEYVDLIRDLPNLKSSPNVLILDECKEILDSIENFSYTIIGDEIFWSFDNKMAGNSKFYPEIQKIIIMNGPKDVISLIKLLN